TLDKIGPMARSVDDLATVLSAIAGADPEDPSALAESWRDSGAPDRLTIGVLPEKTWTGYQAEAIATASAGLKLLASKGHRLSDVKLPDLPFDSLLLTILFTEAAAAFEPLVKSGRHLQLIDPLSKTGLLPGSVIPAIDYVNAQRRRVKAIKAMDELL